MLNLHSPRLWLAATVLALIGASPAYAQLHTAMPTPATASAPITAPRLTPIPNRPATPLPPESPVTAIGPSRPLHADMPEAAVIPPPIVMMPPNLLSPSLIPPGLPTDMTTPVVPVPAGTPQGPLHP
jgi:hypothetical protein